MSDVGAKEYWKAKAQAAKFEEVLATGQPPQAIGTWLPGAIEIHNKALEVCPDHPGVLAWKAAAEAYLKKVEGEHLVGWTPGFPWAQDRFVKGWASLHHARWALANQQWKAAYWAAREARSQWDDCHNVSEWPKDMQWMRESGIADAGSIHDEANRNIKW